MTSLDPNFRDLFECFNFVGVRYLVLGGYAVNFHGHHRNTKGVDLWIAIAPDNAIRVSQALQRFGFPAASVPPQGFLKKGLIYAFGREPLRVDRLTDPSGVDFESCYERRVEGDLGGIRIPFISLDDLKSNKAASGRLRDLSDLENLPGRTPPHAKRPPSKKSPRRASKRPKKQAAP